MPIVNCKLCSSKFYAKPSWLDRGYGKYCSRDCQYEAAKTGKLVGCFICGMKTYKRRKQLEHSKSKKYFCTKSCQTVWRNSILHIGSNHPNWKGGRYAYKSVLLRNKVEAVCRLCKTKDKRILGVHHIDGNKKNNKLKNLVWLCHNCHHLVHNYNINI